MISSKQPDCMINQLGLGFKQCVEERHLVLVAASLHFFLLKESSTPQKMPVTVLGGRENPGKQQLRGAGSWTIGERDEFWTRNTNPTDNHCSTQTLMCIFKRSHVTLPWQRTSVLKSSQGNTLEIFYKRAAAKFPSFNTKEMEDSFIVFSHKSKILQNMLAGPGVMPKKMDTGENSIPHLC